MAPNLNGGKLFSPHVITHRIQRHVQQGRQFFWLVTATFDKINHRSTSHLMFLCSLGTFVLKHDFCGNTRRKVGFRRDAMPPYSRVRKGLNVPAQVLAAEAFSAGLKNGTFSSRANRAVAGAE
jgi:hypothetical protein